MESNWICVKTALISTYDKTGLAPFARDLVKQGITIYSTGGSATLLAQEDIAVTPVEQVTKQAEILAGRVKTLHPVIHAGILARRHVIDDMALLARDGITPIDLVVINLYPFEATTSNPNHTLQAAIENIDVGGPTMIRAAAKNHRDVVVVVDPADYPLVLQELHENNGNISRKLAAQLAVKAFQVTAAYDAVIQNYFSQAYDTSVFPEKLTLAGKRKLELRYGENPHQQAAFYQTTPAWAIGDFTQVQGKTLSYNNLLDLDGALRCVLEFGDTPAAVIVKHTNPCGVAVGSTITEAYEKARSTDPVSAFGSVIALSKPLDAQTATILSETFIECVICPAILPDAETILEKKKNVRVVVPKTWPTNMAKVLEVRSILGGLLLQHMDAQVDQQETWQVVSKRQPTAIEVKALAFNWKVVKHVKSNAIVYGNAEQTLAIGAGQMSRVDSSKIAVAKANLNLKGSVVASDAFFPFRDGIDAAAQAGITAVIQPGGSVRDAEVITAANEHNLAMIFTGVRHFKH